MPSVELASEAGVAITLLDNGAVAAIRAGPILVNQVIGSPAEGGLGNVYLRRHRADGVEAVPVIGPGSGSRFGATPAEGRWEGTAGPIDYACSLRPVPAQPAWTWTVRLTNNSSAPERLDVVLAQDVGLAAEAAVRTSELYTSQYIDHTVVEDSHFGFLLCARQNLPQDGDSAPWLMHGCLDGAAGYLTDAFQLYGLDYRATNVPAALMRATLPNRVYQYEVALPTLQSRPIDLGPGGTTEVTFFGVYDRDHQAASGPDDADRARTLARSLADDDGTPAVGPVPLPVTIEPGRFAAPVLFESEDLSVAELERWFGAERRHEERRDGTLLSFFHGEQQHVVLRAKELLVERPTGHLMLSGGELAPSDDRLAVTAWMFGAFASQVTIGNTSFHKLLSVVRNPLNVLKAGGQRLFMRDAAGLRLLGVPSAFEMGPASARWIYRGGGRTVVVRVSAAREGPVSRLDVEVTEGAPIELVVTNHLVLGEHEGTAPGSVEIDATRGTAVLRPATGALIHEHYPEATFWLVAGDPAAVRSIELEDEHLVVETEAVTRFSLAITGSILDAAEAEERALTWARRGEAPGQPPIASSWTGLGGLALGGASGPLAEDLSRLDDTLRWYAHDALVHFLSPHGLEQSGGAAWGVRDVCQGPVEFLVASGNPGPVRDILRTVYAQQYAQTGDWPQWFMFDRYAAIQQADSHGDVIHWPLKALCDYVEATNDLSILDEEIPFTDLDTMTRTTDVATLFAHVERQVERIERDTIPGTALPVYGGGDWEDTLQPANPDLARHLVSAWTTELAWQTLGRYREVCRRAGQEAMAARLARLLERIRSDFNEYLVPDGVVAGLAYFGGDDVQYFLHPRDRETGVEYRLLPMTRGMISGLFTPEQAAHHLELIERHLLFPDGARLMNRPMAYRGGPSRSFRRAESAANFGREIGLQYVHGHIRYIEAMARLGRADAAFRGLMTICPIGIERDVPSALPRQSNAYFSSSDAAFNDRYEASRDFEALRSGTVGVKGGWRVYSSGPGIYLNQLVSNVLGLRGWFDDVVFDPVLPAAADGLTLDLPFEGRPVRYRFEVSGDGHGARDVRVNGRVMEVRADDRNPYRPGGRRVSRAAFRAALDSDANEVTITL